MRDTLILLKTRCFILLQLNGLNNKSNYKNIKTNYTKIEEVDEDFAQWLLESRSSIRVNSDVLQT